MYLPTRAKCEPFECHPDPVQMYPIFYVSLEGLTEEKIEVIKPVLHLQRSESFRSSCLWNSSKCRILWMPLPIECIDHGFTSLIVNSRVSREEVDWTPMTLICLECLADNSFLEENASILNLKTNVPKVQLNLSVHRVSLFQSLPRKATVHRCANEWKKR